MEQGLSMHSVHVRQLFNARRLTKEIRYSYRGELTCPDHCVSSSVSQSPDMESFIS